MGTDSFHTRQTEILAILANALIEATPEWWDRAILTVEASDEGFGYSIRNEKYPRDIVTPTDEIYSGMFRLQDLFEAHGKSWRRAILEVERIDAEWEYAVRYEY